MVEPLGRRDISTSAILRCALATDLETGAETPIFQGDLIRANRRRLEREPPDVLIQPEAGHIGTPDFLTAAEGIATGERAARAQSAALRRLR